MVNVPVVTKSTLANNQPILRGPIGPLMGFIMTEEIIKLITILLSTLGVTFNQLMDMYTPWVMVRATAFCAMWLVISGLAMWLGNYLVKEGKREITIEKERTDKDSIATPDIFIFGYVIRIAAIACLIISIGILLPDMVAPKKTAFTQIMKDIKQ